VSTLIGILINFVGLDPIKALFWSAVINGVVAVPLMVIIMLMAMRGDVMGRFLLPRALRTMGVVVYCNDGGGGGDYVCDLVRRRKVLREAGPFRSHPARVRLAPNPVCRCTHRKPSCLVVAALAIDPPTVLGRLGFYLVLLVARRKCVTSQPSVSLVVKTC
jgi:hypothetical protein